MVGACVASSVTSLEVSLWVIFTKSSLSMRCLGAALFTGTISFQTQYTLLSLQRQLPTKPFAVVDMKGATLAEAVKQSRAGTHERPGFLHLDGDCHADEAHWELLGSTIPICAVVAKGCYQI